MGYREDRIAQGGWSGTGNQKGNPISEISFLIQAYLRERKY